MPLDHWFAFVLASAVLLAIPGPTVLLVISYALGHGRRAAVASVAGVALGDFTAMTGSMLGLGALLSASSVLFLVLKWIGAAYLIYLGIKLWRAPVMPVDASAADDQPQGRQTDAGRIFAHIYAVTALNPKGIVFFVAFLPQFLDPASPLIPQLAIFEATFLVLAIANATAYGLLASAARRQIRQPHVQRIVNRTGGSLLIDLRSNRQNVT